MPLSPIPRGGRSRSRFRTSYINAPAYEPDDTSAQFTSTEADERLARNKSQAQRLIAAFPQLQTNPQVNEIAESGWQKALGGVGNVLQLLDRPRQVVAMGLADITGFDSDRGGEIKAGDYWKAAIGDREGLKESVGERVVGEDGALSGSHLLSAVWQSDKDDDWWDKALRFGASLGAEVALDPLTYITLGGSALGVRTGVAGMRAVLRRVGSEGVEAVVRSGAKSALRNVGESTFEAGIRGAIKHAAEASYDDILEEMLEKATKEATEQGLETLSREAVEEVSGAAWERAVREAAGVSINDEIVGGVLGSYQDELAEVISKRNFGSEAPKWGEYLDFVGKTGEARYTQGGLRFGLPFSKEYQTAPIPGTRGLAAKTRQKAFDLLPDKPVFSRWADRIEKLRVRLDIKNPEIAAARQGRYTPTHALRAIAEATSKKFGLTEGRGALWSSYADLHETIRGLDDETQKLVMNNIMPALQRGRPLAEVMDSSLPSAVKSAYAQVVEDGHRLLGNLYGALEEVAPGVGKITNYVPIQFTEEFRQVIHRLSDAGALPPLAGMSDEQIARYAAKLDVTTEELNAFIEVHYSMLDGARRLKNLGSSQELRRRSLGRVLARADAVDDEALTRWLTAEGEDTLQIAYQDVAELGDSLSRITERLVEDADHVKLPKGWRGAIETDPARQIDTYFADIERAVYEKAMFMEGKRQGLIRPHEFRQNLDKVLQEIDPLFNVTPRIVERVMTDGRPTERVAKMLAKKKAVKIGDSVIEMPAHLLETRRGRRALERAQKAFTTAERHSARIRAERQQLVNKLRRELPGADDGLLHTLVGLRSTDELERFRAEILEEARRFHEESSEAIMRALEAAASEEVGLLDDAAFLSRSATDEFWMNVRQAMQDVESRWDELAGADRPRSTNLVVYDEAGEIDVAATDRVLSEFADALADRVGRFVDARIGIIEERIAEVQEEIVTKAPAVPLPLEQLDDVPVDELARLAEEGEQFSFPTMHTVDSDLAPLPVTQDAIDEIVPQIPGQEQLFRTPTPRGPARGKAVGYSIADDPEVAGLMAELNDLSQMRSMLEAAANADEQAVAIGLIGTIAQMEREAGEGVRDALLPLMVEGMAQYEDAAIVAGRQVRMGVKQQMLRDFAEDPSLFSEALQSGTVIVEGTAGRSESASLLRFAARGLLEMDPEFKGKFLAYLRTSAELERKRAFHEGILNGDYDWITARGLKAPSERLLGPDDARFAQALPSEKVPPTIEEFMGRAPQTDQEWIAAAEFWVWRFIENRRAVYEGRIGDLTDGLMLGEDVVFAPSRPIASLKQLMHEPQQLARTLEDPAQVEAINRALRATMHPDARIVVASTEGGIPRVALQTGEIIHQPPPFKMRELIAKIRDGEMDFDQVLEAARRVGDQQFVDDVERFRVMDDTLRGLQRQSRVSRLAATNRLKGAAQASATMGEIIDAFDAAVYSGRGFGRLRNVVFEPKQGGKAALSPAMRNLEKFMPPEQFDLLKRMIDRAWFADQRLTPMTKRMLANNEKLWSGKLYTPVGQSVHQLQMLMAEMSADAVRAATNEEATSRALVAEFAAEISGIRSFATTLDEDGIAVGLGYRLVGDNTRSALGKTYDDHVEAATRLAKKLKQHGDIKDREYRRIVDLFNSAGKERSVQLRQPAEGLQDAAEFGLGGVLKGHDVDPFVAVMFENLVDNMRALHTPFAVGQISESARAVVKWWKAGATVARPSFHMRNLVSGIANGILIGVGPQHYQKVTPQVIRFRRALARGVDKPWLEVADWAQPYFKRAWEDGIFQTSFARAEQLAGKGVSKELLNPLSYGNAAFRAGGVTMETIEDTLRMAAYYRWLDPSHIEETADLAREMVIAVHFDYTNLTSLEQKMKVIAPFFVWTRRNTPLQLKAMLEQPGYTALWGHIQRAAQDNFGGDNPYPMSPYSNGLATDMGPIRDGEFWERLIFDPDLPVGALEDLPLFDADSGGVLPFSGAALSPTAWINWSAQLLGPQFKTPFDLLAAESRPDVNAPTGFNAIFVALHEVGMWDNVSGAGDAQIPPALNTLIHTALPFYEEYRAGLGIAPNDPNRAQREGFVEGEPLTALDRAMLALENTILRGTVGLERQTPVETKGQAFDAQQFLNEMTLRQRQRLSNDN